jgi:hypothetical protein
MARTFISISSAKNFSEPLLQGTSYPDGHTPLEIAQLNKKPRLFEWNYKSTSQTHPVMRSLDGTGADGGVPKRGRGPG